MSRHMSTYSDLECEKESWTRTCEIQDSVCEPAVVGRRDDTVGNHHRAQISQFELFELTLLLKLDKQFPVE